MKHKNDLPLLIPYFELLRLGSWIHASDPYPLAGVGDTSLLSDKIVLNKFSLIHQSRENSSEELFTQLAWEMSTRSAAGTISLWFLFGPLMTVVDMAQVRQAFRQYKPTGMTYAISLLIGLHNCICANVSLYEPFADTKPLYPLIVLPSVDDSARNHWRKEMQENVQDAQLPVYPPLFTYACRMAEARQFFEETDTAIPLNGVHRIEP